MTTSLTEQLAAFIAKTSVRDIPGAVIARAKVSLLHDFAMTLAGRRVETTAHGLVRQLWSVPGEATVLWDGSKASLEGAAFANAALMHARAQDDTHPASTSHPGAAVIPTALATAEARGRTGAEFLTACVLGYEAIGRIGRDMDHLVTPSGFRPATLFGVFGAATAAAKLLGLDAAATASALGFAAHLAGGLGQVWAESSPEWALQLGFTARNGVTSALAAQNGAVASRQILEGPMGFCHAYAGASTAAENATDRLGEIWQISEATVKFYPVCAILQGPVDKMLELSRAHDLAAADVEQVVLELNPFEANYPGTDNPGPYTTHTATMMSGQFCVGLALCNREVTIDGMLRFDDAQVNSLATRVRVVGDDKLALRSCRLKIRTTDGRLIAGDIDSPVGRPSFDEAAAFVRRLMPEMSVGPSAVERLIDTVARIENVPSVEPLLSCLVPQRA